MRTFTACASRGTLAVMPSERTNYGMLVECDGHAKYTGKKRPTCDKGKGCTKCWQVHNQYLDDHRPKMSRDFKEFYDYVSKFKRMLQASKMEWPTNLSLYQMLSNIEKVIREGSYRHHMITLDHTLEEFEEMAKSKRKPRALPPRS